MYLVTDNVRVSWYSVLACARRGVVHLVPNPVLGTKESFEVPSVVGALEGDIQAKGGAGGGPGPPGEGRLLPLRRLGC